ncbi:MAG: hypothetical protein L0154_28560 [Chloroflexi bacterium]|nr:hypothetical protein [Chloroflexota bacterium]
MLPQSTDTLFTQAVHEQWTSEMDWLWLAAKVERTDQLIVCLENALRLNPNNENTQQQLRALQHTFDGKKTSATLRKFISSTKQLLF